MEVKTRVYVLKTGDRLNGIQHLFNEFDVDFSDKSVALKANFNSDDPFPASTHIDTLGSLIKAIQADGADEIKLGERSGMGDTRSVLEGRGVFALAKELGFEVIVLDEMDKAGWVKVDRGQNHWLRGFHISGMFIEADIVVQTCCLKTHRFGGHFSLSLKNSVGLIARRLPGSIYNYMWELHGSPYQRLMIAEINKHYNCDIVIMDALRAFTDGGPEKGTSVEPGLLLASTDRVAIDAVGIAILRGYVSTKNVMNGRIFELPQINRAAELGVGVNSPGKIEVVPVNAESVKDAETISVRLVREG